MATSGVSEQVPRAVVPPRRPHAGSHAGGRGSPARAGRFCSRPRRTALISDLGEAGQEGARATGAHVGPWQERAPWWPRERGFCSKHRWALLLLHHGVSLAPRRPPSHPGPGLPLPGRRGRGQVLPVDLWVRGDVSSQPCPSPGCTSPRSGVADSMRSILWCANSVRPYLCDQTLL